MRGGHRNARAFTNRAAGLCKGKRALIVGVADDQGYGWAIAKALAEAGVNEIMAATWVPAHGIFQKMLERGKLDSSRYHHSGDRGIESS